MYIKEVPKLEILDRERFIHKINFKPENNNKGCWEWIGACTGGKGSFTLQGNQYQASRVAYFAQYGTQPKNLICHSCDNPKCVNPTHLFEGTQFDNMDDMVGKNRQCGGRKQSIPSHLCDQIRQEFENGVSIRNLAETYAVSLSCITNVVKCKGAYA